MALLAPGRRALRDPQPLVQRLLDLPVTAAYVQPLTPRSGVPAFEHLETWLSLLARAAQLVAARSE